jgi:hypothetical protein
MFRQNLTCDFYANTPVGSLRSQAQAPELAETKVVLEFQSIKIREKRT